MRALTALSGVSLFITLPPLSSNAPFNPSAVNASEVYHIENFDRDRRLEGALAAFDPEVLLVVSWHHRNYRWCLGRSQARARVLCMDNQWHGTAKQRLGVATAGLHVRPYYEAVFLPGPRQREFANRLGFSNERIFEGFYSADRAIFQSTGPLDRVERRAFVFVGRLVPEKGIDTLEAAYLGYRAQVADPWDLIVAGVGPEAARLGALEGVRMAGFTQPRDLPSVFARARFLVVPSRFEPFGVVVHEAVASGLGILSSDRVGAADTLVSDGGNGYLVKAGDSDALAKAMARSHHLTESELCSVQSVSLRLAEQYHPHKWAETVLHIGRTITRS